jgi:serine/threonine-protein kinase RsbW
MSDANDTHRVVLRVPALGEFARTVRIAAAELATRAGMDLDDVEDVRLAVEEAFVFASERNIGSDLTFTFDIEPGVITLAVSTLVPACAEDGPDTGERYARFILESICDEFELVETDGECHMRLVKRSA